MQTTKMLLHFLNLPLVVVAMLCSGLSFAQNNSIFYGGSGGGSTGICTPLPIILPLELVDFHSRCYKDSLTIEWETLSENSVDYYLLEKSKDGIHWEDFGQVNAHGSASSKLTYSFTCKLNASAPITYFRLKRVDLDGQHYFSGVISASPCSSSSLIIFPNPTSGQFTMYWDELTADTQISIFNNLGQLVFQNKSEISTITEIDLSNLPAGTYFIELSTGVEVLSRCKLIKI